MQDARPDPPNCITRVGFSTRSGRFCLICSAGFAYTKLGTSYLRNLLRGGGSGPPLQCVSPGGTCVSTRPQEEGGIMSTHRAP